MEISIYVIQILFIILCGYVFRDNKKRFLIFAFFALFFVMAFRHALMVGYDSTSSYYDLFTKIQSNKLEWPNIGLPIVMKIIHLFKGEYQWVIVFSATWVCCAYYKLLVKYSENGFISVMWFMGMLYYTFLFSALKQAWAMGFICFAFDAIFKKRPIRFFVLIVLAALFHFPALIFLPAYWISKLKINRAFPILMLGLLVIVFIFRTQILNLMVSTYSSGENEYSSDVQFIGSKVVLMILMLAFGFYQYFKHNYLNYFCLNLFSLLIYFMGIAVVIQTFCYYSNVFERLADYYFQFSILYVPLLISNNEFEVNQIDKNDLPHMKDISSSSATKAKKKIRNYSKNDISISTVFAIVITAFCIWRYISNMINDPLMSPFYFFWQNVNVSMRFK